MKRHFTHVSALLVLLLSACGSDEVTCGEGTTLIGGACLPEIGACAPGTEAVDGDCVPVCGAGYFFDYSDEACKAIPDCGVGTTFDPKSGSCVVRDDTCGPGTTYIDGKCLPDVGECGPGTTREGGECVPERLPPPDVTETEDPAGAAVFELPAPGATVTLGGVVDSPFVEHPQHPEYLQSVADWDRFTFVGSQGTWIRLDSMSEDAAMPGFIVQSAAADDDGRPYYMRVCMEPNAPGCGRELYLPFTDQYVIFVTDFTNLVAALLDVPLLPVGGPEFTYRITVENLGEPSPIAVSSLPFTAAGDFTTGELAFFSVPEDLTPDALYLTSHGEPVEGEVNEVAQMLTLLEAGEVLYFDQRSRYVNSDLSILTPAANGESYLIVHDFDIVIGPNRAWTLTIDERIAVDCMLEDCDGSLDPNDTHLLRWDLEPGELLAATISADPDDTRTFDVIQLDRELIPMKNPRSVSRQANAPFTHYAEEPIRIYARLFGNGQSDPRPFTVESAITMVAELTVDEAAEIDIAEYPEGSLPDSGFALITAAAGQIVTTSGLALLEGAWGEPREDLLRPDFTQVGPAFDALAEDVRDSFADRFYAWALEGGSYLHRVRDAGEQAAGSAYSVTYHLQEPEELGLVGTDGKTSEAYVHEESRLAFFTFTAEPGTHVTVTITPGAEALPRVALATLGAPGWAYRQFRWVADTEGQRVAEIAHGAASAPGQQVTVGAIVPYDGDVLVAIEDLGAGFEPALPLQIRVEATPAPDHDACPGARVIDLESGAALVLGDTTGATDRIRLASNNQFTKRDTAGPDVFHSVTMEAGQTLTARLLPLGFEGALYLLAECGETPVVVAGAAPPEEDAETHLMEHTSAEGGDYILVVGGYLPGDFGPFELEVELAEP